MSIWIQVTSNSPFLHEWPPYDVQVYIHVYVPVPCTGLHTHVDFSGYKHHGDLCAVYMHRLPCAPARTCTHIYPLTISGSRHSLQALTPSAVTVSYEWLRTAEDAENAEQKSVRGPTLTLLC